jgi:drug/metabolite transporter (DMT)-like permease
VLMTIAVRIGEVSVVAPFRYTVVLFGLLGGWLVWSEVPNVLAATGIVVVVAAGLYTFMRERARTSSK